jgi:hypothetical protein
MVRLITPTDRPRTETMGSLDMVSLQFCQMAHRASQIMRFSWNSVRGKA